MQIISCTKNYLYREHVVLQPDTKKCVKMMQVPSNGANLRGPTVGHQKFYYVHDGAIRQP